MANTTWKMKHLSMEKKIEIAQYMANLRNVGMSKKGIIDTTFARYQDELIFDEEGRMRPGYLNVYDIVYAIYKLLYEL